MTLQNEIHKFLESKDLSENSKSSYRYDLQQFSAFFEARKVTKESLQIYSKQLSSLTFSAQKRKISAINQFLLYLYNEKRLADYLQLPRAEKLEQENLEIPTMKDYSDFYRKIESPGQFIALLILETGLTPSEICKLKWENFNWRFNILEVEQNGLRRVLPFQNKFAVRAKIITNGDELFTKSRQSLHKELKKYTEYTARELREQFILKKVREGLSIYKLAELLGLKTSVTLEKYYRTK